MNSMRLWRGWITPGLCVLAFLLGVYFEKMLNDSWLNSPLLEGRSRGIKLYIELSRKVFDTGNVDMMKSFLDDSMAKKDHLMKGADSEDFINFWVDWENEVQSIVRERE